MNISKPEINILVIEDNFADFKFIQYSLESLPKNLRMGSEYNLKHADYLHTGLSFLQKGQYDVVLVDLNLPDTNGLDSLHKVIEVTDIPVIVMTGLTSIELALEAVSAGAQDWFTKGEVETSQLVKSIQYAIERHNNRKLKIDVAVQEDRLRTLQQLLADVSHDFRTPLTVISTSLYLFRKTGKEEHLDIMSSQISHMTSLLDDFSQMSKLDFNIDQPEFSLQDVVAFVRKVATEQQSVASQKDHTIYFRSNEDECYLEFDNRLLYRAIANLISNSIKYTEDGGEIHVSIVCEDGDIKVVVEDNGQGISEKDLPYVFDRLFRGDRVRNSIGSSGLGLAITKKIVEIHGAKIDIQSEINVGTRVTISFRDK